MPRVSAACVAAASSQTGGGSSSGSGGAAAANAAVLFDRTMQNVVDKLFPHFAAQERLEEDELQQYMQQHQHKQLPPEYLTGPLASGVPLRREALAHRRARVEGRAATEGALGAPPLDMPAPQEPQQQQESAAVTPQDGVEKQQREGICNSQLRAMRQLLQQPPLDEFVDQLLGAPSCFDEQQTTAIALLPDKYQGQLMQARLQHQAAQLSHSSQEGPGTGGAAPDTHGLVALPLELPQLERPYLRVPSRMSIHLVLRYLASQLQVLLFPGEPLAALSVDGSLEEGEARTQARDPAGPPEGQIDLEMALELTLEGRVLGRSHSIDFVRKARRLNCVGKCLLLQYRYTAQTETKVVFYHLARINQGIGGPPDAFLGGAAATPEAG